MHNPTTTADIAKHNGANMNGEQEPVATGILATAKLATADTALVLEWGTADPSNNSILIKKCYKHECTWNLVSIK